MPQAIQIVFGWKYGLDTEKRGYLLGALIAMILDVFTDSFYKSDGFTLHTYWAIGNSIVFYSFLSEFLLVFTFGLLVSNLGKFIVALGNGFSPLFSWKSQ